MVFQLLQPNYEKGPFSSFSNRRGHPVFTEGDPSARCSQNVCTTAQSSHHGRVRSRSDPITLHTCYFHSYAGFQGSLLHLQQINNNNKKGKILHKNINKITILDTRIKQIRRKGSEYTGYLIVPGKKFSK